MLEGAFRILDDFDEKKATISCREGKLFAIIKNNTFIYFKGTDDVLDNATLVTKSR